jgi:branched-subunit amino acid aminotransferase/4-amino-4-deoxychorismate lyase
MPSILGLAGHVAETTVTNIVLVRDGRLLSPLPTCFLDSLTKRHVFDLARGLDPGSRVVPDQQQAEADDRGAQKVRLHPAR